MPRSCRLLIQTARRSSLRRFSICKTARVVLPAFAFPVAARAAYTFNTVLNINTSQFNVGVFNITLNNTGTVAFLGESGPDNNPVSGFYTTPANGNGPITTIVTDNGAYSNIRYWFSLNYYFVFLCFVRKNTPKTFTCWTQL